MLAQGAPTAERHSPLVNVCLRWESQFPIRFYSMHTEPEEEGGTLRTAARTLNRLADFGAVIVVGDFNATPNERAMDSMYKATTEDPRGKGKFFEADEYGFPCLPNSSRCGALTFPTSPLRYKKIDYIFADFSHFAPHGMDAWVEGTGGQCGGADCSDHYMLWGEVALGPEGQLHCGEVRQTIPIVGEPDSWVVDWEVTVVQGATGCDEALRVLRTYIARSPDFDEGVRWRAVPQMILGWSCIENDSSVYSCRQGEVPATPEPPEPDRPVIGALVCAEWPCDKQFILELPHCGTFGCRDELRLWRP